jgi:UDP-glucose:(heptosyl)LPS alpha-1,3-glucosyltransferase
MATAWVEKKGILDQPGNRILPVSNLVRKELLNVYDIPECRMQVIHPGVSMGRFKGGRGEEWRSEIRQRHGLAPADLVVLFVGMNFEVKGLETVLKGIAQVAGERRPKLVIIGKGDSGRYLRMAAELGIRKQVVFAGIANEVEKYYHASDIFVLPSLFDTFGLVVLEAMAAGLPVIVSEKVGAADLVQDGVNGFVLKAGGASSDLAQTFKRLENKETRLEAGKRAQETALLYSWDRTASQTAELYRLCVAEKGKSRPPRH